MVMRPRRVLVAGLSLAGVVTPLFAAFIVGETFSDPGGWKAAVLVAAWLLPLAGLTAMAWWRPAWAMPILAALTAAAIGLSIWLAIAPSAWRVFESQHGPVRAILTVVLTAPLAVLGLRLAAQAGVLLIVLGVIPLQISVSRGIGGLGSIAIASLVPVVTGVLYVLAAVLAHWSDRSCALGAAGDPGDPSGASDGTPRTYVPKAPAERPKVTSPGRGNPLS